MQRAADGRHSAAHDPLYPICVTNMQDASNMTGAPTLNLAGVRDGGAPPQHCEDYVAHMKARNVAFPVTVRVYPGAYHGWDDEQNRGEYNPHAPSAANCIPLFLSPQGRFVSMLCDGKEAPFERSILSCPGAGDTMAFDGTQRERSTHDMIEFLKVQFAAVR